MVYQFKWKPGSRIRINSQRAGERITSLKERLGGVIAPRDLVRDARSINSPLHSAFEWNNSKAAEQYREQQAGHMLRCLVTECVDRRRPNKPIAVVRAFVNVRPPGTAAGDRSYRPLIDVLDDEELRHELIQTAAAEFKAWRARYSELQELSRIFHTGNLVFGKILATKGKRNKKASRAAKPSFRTRERQGEEYRPTLQ